MSSELGTIKFMAPELFKKKVKYNEKVDIFALAVILYLLLVG